MNRIDLIRWALQMSEECTARFVADMHQVPLTRPAPGAAHGGNHPLWTVGHLAVIEGGVKPILVGGPNPVERWKPLFAAGTEPLSDASAYPPFDEVLQTYRDLRGATVRLLDEIGEAGLDRPPQNVPPGFEDAMQTAGQALLLLALHNMLHNGQLADARRAAGRRPLL